MRTWPVHLTRRAALGSIALLAAGCGGSTSPGDDPAATPATGSADLHALAEQYVRLTLKLARHQKTLVETWLGPADWNPGAREPVDGIRQDIVALRAALDEAGSGMLGRRLEQHRLLYLRGQARALHTAAQRLLGEAIGFAKEAELAYEIRNAGGGPQDGRVEDRVAGAREQLERAVPGKGALVDRIVRFQRDHAIPRARLDATLVAAVTACRDGTAAMIPLPNGESCDLGLQDGLGLEGWAVYQGHYRTRVRIEGAAPFDVAHLLWLAAHETYPGHHLQYVLAERDLVRAHDWQERQLHAGFGPHLLHSEGLAENGADLLLEGDTFARLCRDVLVPVAGVKAGAVARLVAIRRALTGMGHAIPPIAAAYLDGGLSTDAAVARLRNEAAVPNPEAFLMTIEKQRTRVLAYPVGADRTTLRSDSPDRWSDLADAATFLAAPSDVRLD